jgi:multiple sugar transport system ATP-binding protein
VVVGIRPECFADADFGDPRLPQIEVSVNRVEELGATTEAMFTLDEERLELEGVGAPDDDGMLLADDHRAHFTAKLDPRTTAAVGRRLRLCVDTARIHFFDPETGANIDGTPGVA